MWQKRANQENCSLFRFSPSGFKAQFAHQPGGWLSRVCTARGNRSAHSGWASKAGAPDRQGEGWPAKRIQPRDDGCLPGPPAPGLPLPTRGIGRGSPPSCNRNLVQVKRKYRIGKACTGDRLPLTVDVATLRQLVDLRAARAKVGISRTGPELWYVPAERECRLAV